MIDLLSSVVFLPLVGACALLLLPRGQDRTVKLAGIFVSVVTFVASLWLYFAFEGNAPGFQFDTKVLWIPALNISYHVGIDGISLMLVVLTTFLTPIALLSSWNAIEKRHFLQSARRQKARQQVIDDLNRDIRSRNEGQKRQQPARVARNFGWRNLRQSAPEKSGNRGCEQRNRADVNQAAMREN